MTSFLNMLCELEKKRDSDGCIGSYRDEALHVFGQPGLAGVLAKRGEKDAAPTSDGLQPARIVDFLTLIESGIVPDFSDADKLVTNKTFDAAYVQAVERCDLFAVQKMAAEMNSRAARIGVLCGKTGINPAKLNVGILDDAANGDLAAEVAGFRLCSEEFAMLMAFEFTRHAGLGRESVRQYVLECMDTVGSDALGVIGSLRSMRSIAPANWKGPAKAQDSLRIKAASIRQAAQAEPASNVPEPVAVKPD